MTQSLDRPPLPRATSPRATTPQAVPHTLWRLAGILALAHVVLIFAGIALQNAARLDEGLGGVERAYVEGNLARTMTGGYVELIGFLLLVPVLVFLARVVGRRTEAGRWATQTALMAGIGYVVLTFAPGMAAGAAAMYGAQHDADLGTALMMNNLRVLTYVVSLLLLGAHAIGLGVAAVIDGELNRWVGWGGLVTGAALFVAVPLAAANLHDYGTLVWIVWWVGVAVTLLRHHPTEE
ncbi:MAG TPA: hypothetical protein VFO98_09540 [Marmoricola sp.]|nr:hypothetical protein [Marmoricola sp.]